MFWRSWWAKLIGVVAITVVGLLIYSETFDSVFHLDDFFFIQGNPGIRNLANWQNYGKGVIDTHSRYAVFATFALNYAVHNIEVFGYHVVNFAIHILTSLGIWWLGVLILRTPRFAQQFSMQQRLWLGFFVAFLFLAHPVNTQAVTYMSQRFASMATLFYVWSLGMYVYARLFSSSKKRVFCYISSALFLLIAALSKEITLTFPLIIVFFELFLLNSEKRLNIGAFVKKNGVMIGVLLVVALIIPFRFGFGIKDMFFGVWDSESHAGDKLTFWTYQMTQWRVWIVFLRLIFVPINQNLDYDFPMSHSLIDPITTIFSVIALIGLAVLTWKKRNDWPHLMVGFAWFVLTLSVNVIPRAHVIFEHKLYLAMIGFLFTIVLTVAYAFKKSKTRYVVLLMVVAIFAGLTFQRNKVWENEVTLWTDVIKKSPNKHRANLNLGKAYVEVGKLDLAMKHLNRALELKPGDEKALNNRGLVYHKWGEFQKALDDFNQATSTSSNYVEVYNNRGVVYKDLGKYEEAIRDYKMALKINPAQAETYNNLGVVYRKQKRLDEALQVFHRALKLKFNKYPDALVNMGNVYRDKEKPEEALKYYNHAVSLNPQNPVYFANRANVNNDLGMKQQAFNDFNRAIQLNPKMAVLYLSRGLFLQKEKKLVEAAQDYARVLQLDPKNINAQNNIAVVFQLMKQYGRAMEEAKKALAINPKLPTAFYILIMSCLDNGGTEECLSYVDTAIERGLNFDPKIQARIDEVRAQVGK